MTVPKTLGACVDRLYKLRQERAKHTKKADEIKKQITELKTHLIDCIGKSDAEGVTGRTARVRVLPKTVATVKDWDKFWAYIRRHKAHHLMQRRVASPAVLELWEDGKQVPGVEAYHYKDVSCTKK
jgi:ribosomal protein L29